LADKKCDVEVLVRGAHDQIIEGLFAMNVTQLKEGLQWSRTHYGKLDVERLLEMAIEMHEGTEKH